MEIIKKNWQLIVLIIISVFLLFYNLGADSLKDWDEGMYTQIYKEIATNLSLTLHYYSESWFDKPPLGFWIGGLSIKIFGDSEFAIRFIPAIFALLSIITIFFIGKKLFNKNIGFCSALFTIISPAFLYDHISRRGDLESGYLLLFLLSIYFFILSLEKPKKILLASLFAGLAFMYRGAVALLIPAIIFSYIFLTNSWKHYKKYYLKSIFIFSGIVLPWHIYEYILYKKTFLDIYFFGQILSRINNPSHVHYYPWFHYLNFLKWKMGAFLILTIIGFISSIFLYFKKHNKKYLFLILWLILSIIPITLMKTKLFWYIVPALPVISIISIAPFFEILKSRKIILKIFCTVLIIFSFYFVYHDIKQITKPSIDSIELIAKDIEKIEKNNNTNILVYKTSVFLVKQLEPQANYYLRIKHSTWNVIGTKENVNNNFLSSNNINYIIIPENELKNFANYTIISSHKDADRGKMYLLSAQLK